MNIFTYLGDLLHLSSFFILFLKIYGTKNCKGISLKTLGLYSLVFMTRYLDLFLAFSSLYLTTMKIVYIGISTSLVYMLAFVEPYCRTYNSSMDYVNLAFVIGPCAVLALIFNERFTIREIFWAFSYFLEAVAFVPQLMIIRQLAKHDKGRVEGLTMHYVVAMGAYRALYMLNWIYRWVTDVTPYWHPLIWVTGTVQTALFSDFIYIFVKSYMTNTPMTLPV